MQVQSEEKRDESGISLQLWEKGIPQGKATDREPERAVVPSEQTDRTGNFKLFCLPLTNTNQPTCAQRKSIYDGGIGWIPVVLGSFQSNSSYKWHIYMPNAWDIADEFGVIERRRQVVIDGMLWRSEFGHRHVTVRCLLQPFSIMLSSLWGGR